MSWIHVWKLAQNTGRFLKKLHKLPTSTGWTSTQNQTSNLFRFFSTKKNPSLQKTWGFFRPKIWKFCGLTKKVLFLPHLDVSENNGTPKSSILIGFSIIFTIHFGGPPLFLEPPIFLFQKKNNQPTSSSAMQSKPSRFRARWTRGLSSVINGIPWDDWTYVIYLPRSYMKMVDFCMVCFFRVGNISPIGSYGI